MSLNKVSRARSFIVGIVSLTLVFLTPTGFANNDLPDLGTAAVNTLSLEKEKAYGDAYMRVIRASAPMLNDPVLEQYITELGNKLVAHATDVKTPFYFFLLRNDEINAFAFFGGHVGIHSGLFLNADNESQLASVISHEIVHITQRHLARSLEANQKNSTTTIAGLLGAILLAIAVPQAGLAALATTQALSTQTQINYTRAHEKEADRLGMQILVDSGFSPNSQANFFTKLANKYQFASKLPQMLLTHPLPESRITEARNRAAQYPHRRILDNLNFQLAKARIQVRFSSYSSQAALALFKNKLKKQKYTFKSAAEYGLALALLRLNKNKEAEKIIDKLRAKDADNLFYIDTKTDLLLARHQYKQAINLLEKQRRLKPTSQVIAINLANSFIESKQPHKAIPILEDLIFANKQDILSVSMLSDAYGEDDNRAMEYYVHAEYLALLADYGGAIKQLKSAYNLFDKNSLQRIKIQAKIQQYKRSKQTIEKL